MNDMEALGEALALIKCISECSMLQEAHERSRKIGRGLNLRLPLRESVVYVL